QKEGKRRMKRGGQCRHPAGGVHVAVAHWALARPAKVRGTRYEPLVCGEVSLFGRKVSALSNRNAEFVTEHGHQGGNLRTLSKNCLISDDQKDSSVVQTHIS